MAPSRFNLDDMNQRASRATVILALLALVSALSTPGIFLWPLNAFRIQGYYDDHPLLVASMDALRILFLLVPVAGMVAAVLKKRWSLYCTMAFPIIAWVFGASAVPFLEFAFPSVTPRTIAITVINLCVIALAVWLRWGASNYLSKRTR